MSFSDSMASAWFPERLANAEGFGFGAGINRAMVRAREQGIVTSASLMVRQPATATSNARPAGQLAIQP